MITWVKLLFAILQEKFEEVNQAYEFLCSRSSWTTDGPNPHNIVLVLQTQSILFHRYSEGTYVIRIFYFGFLIIIVPFYFFNVGYYASSVRQNVNKIAVKQIFIVHYFLTII